MLTLLDLLVVGAYCLLFLGLGLYFRKLTRSSSDYFRGGGRMPWWLVGASTFMSAFSAWTFTGAAGVAYEHGIVIITFYLINAAGLLFAAIFLAPWYRQTRVITAMEAVAQRFGRANEQVFTWLQIPGQMVASAVQLFGMAIFLAPILGISVQSCVLAGGGVVVFMSAVGGSWAVITGDFVQALLIVPVTGVLAFFALKETGGMGHLVERLPPSHLDPIAIHAPGFGLLWIAALAVEKFVLLSGLGNSSRFLAVKNSAEARKAAILAAALTALGALLWFLPPLAAKALAVNLGQRFPGAANPAENAYAAMAMDLLPHGILGILVAGILGTTLSSMDTGLNRNSGIFVRSFYRPRVRPGASEAELVRVGKLSTVIMGGVIISIALLYSAHSHIGIFSLMMNIAAMLGVPVGIPLFLGLVVRKAPDWAAWSTVLLGFAISAILLVLPDQPWVIAAAQREGWSHSLVWLGQNPYSGKMLINASLTTLWFLGTTLLWRTQSPQRTGEVSTFFRTMHTPVVGNEGGETKASNTPRILSGLCFVYAVFFLAIDLVPNTTRGRLSVAFCSGFFLVIAALLRWSSCRPCKKPSSA